MTPLTRDVVWAGISFASFLGGLAIAIRYVLRQRLAVVFRHAVGLPTPRTPKSEPPTRDRLPTLTGIQVDKAVEGLARQCREAATTPRPGRY